jgi:hypothetical protein
VYVLKIFGADTSSEQQDQFIDYVHNLRNASTKVTYLGMWKRADALTRNIYVNSWMQVMDFRRKNPEIVALWNRLRDQLEASIGGNFEVALPSGRTLTYFDVTKIDDGIQARTERGAHFTYFHGGLLAENVTQAFARDVFCAAQIRAEEAGLNVLLDVYDELVCDEPQHRNPDDLLAVLRARPSWAKTLPVDGEVVTSKHYCK